MRKIFTEEQIIVALKEPEAGAKAADRARQLVRRARPLRASDV